MKLQHWFSLFTYWFISNTSILGIPLLFYWGTYDSIQSRLLRIESIASTWEFLCKIIIIIIIFVLLKGEFKKTEDNYTLAKLILWIVCGVLTCLMLQVSTSWIKQLFGEAAGSENTAELIERIRYIPLTIINIVILAPIAEELVFRFIIFKQLNQRFNTFIPAALISSILFALIHNDLPNILSYIATGFVFSFLFYKTKRIWIPIVCHMTLNSIVIVAQLL